ncbi:16S rRNA (guanine(966)-N(2))-methyltransferase RsmD [Salinispirillum sp. LH 10-3-1]|uniref:Ribosomal RNA small subunit methyltransferase D n=1 Tax=Salinispirillum sp. LH 10-3-1 TaxID=2952525 RepID=A0AB38YFY9_9GAMM
MPRNNKTVAVQRSENSLRITGGEMRGRRFHFAVRPGLRPTLERERERLFNWLQYDLAGRRILDGFAGSGVLGLEALSRAAAHCTFVERDAVAAKAINQTVQTFRCAERSSVVTADFFSWIQAVPDTFDLVFLDPPFAADLFEQAVAAIAAAPAVRSGALIYVEAPASYAPVWGAAWTVEKDKKSGSLVQYLVRKN